MTQVWVWSHDKFNKWDKKCDPCTIVKYIGTPRNPVSNHTKAASKGIQCDYTDVFYCTKEQLIWECWYFVILLDEKCEHSVVRLTFCKSEGEKPVIQVILGTENLFNSKVEMPTYINSSSVS